VECDAVQFRYPDAGNSRSLCNVNAPTRLNGVTFKKTPLFMVTDGSISVTSSIFQQ